MSYHLPRFIRTDSFFISHSLLFVYGVQAQVKTLYVSRVFIYSPPPLSPLRSLSFHCSRVSLCDTLISLTVLRIR